MERLFKVLKPIKQLVANIEAARERSYQKRREEEIGRLSLLEDFPHQEDCPRRNGIREHFEPSVQTSWISEVYKYRVCLDCEKVERF